MIKNNINFNEIKYERLDYDKTKKSVEELISKLIKCDNYNEYLELVKEIIKIQNHIEEMFDYADINNMRNVEDKFFVEEIKYWNENKVKYDSLFLPFYNELNNLPLILQKEESNSRKLLDYVALQNNVNLIPKMEVVSQELITEFTNIGLGIGFSIIDLAKRNYKNLKELNINKKIPNINIYLATNKSVSLTFASKMFIKYLKK